MKTTFSRCAILLAVLSLAYLPMGCLSESKVSVLLSADLGGGAKMEWNSEGDTPLEDILSLQVTLTKITLARVGAVPSQTAEEGEDEGGIPSQVIVFEGALDVELRDLVGISELLAEADIPAGRYTRIWLAIENPRLVLASNPDEVITNVHLTANSRLFVQSQFEIPADQRSLLLLDFQGLHLVETGAGKFVWTPHLRAEISVESADVLIEGVIESVDSSAETLVLLPTSEVDSITVNYADAAIYLAEDADTPTGTAADLVAGVQLVVEGVLNLSGEVTAEVIWLLPTD